MIATSLSRLALVSEHSPGCMRALCVQSTGSYQASALATFAGDVNLRLTFQLLLLPMGSSRYSTRLLLLIGSRLTNCNGVALHCPHGYEALQQFARAQRIRARALATTGSCSALHRHFSEHFSDCGPGLNPCSPLFLVLTLSLARRVCQHSRSADRDVLPAPMSQSARPCPNAVLSTPSGP